MHYYATMGIAVGVLGASGYAGGEILRLLAGHPSAQVLAAGAERGAGAGVVDLHPQLAGLDLNTFQTHDEVLASGADVLFSCLPEGALDALAFSPEGVVIDLSGDHRADDSWTYGLTEWNRPVQGTARIANPGCYPTASLLALLPFCRAGVIEGTIVIDGMSGASGAGRSAEGHLGFAHLHGTTSAYGTVSHKHVPEIEGQLFSIGGLETQVSFTPHLVPQSRGLLITARATLCADLDDATALEILREAYKDEPFVHVTEGWPSTKPVAGTNRAHVSARVDPRTGFLVASAAIDNLGKGAAGQAIQNMNAALGLEETTGLGMLGTWP